MGSLGCPKPWDEEYFIKDSSHSGPKKKKKSQAEDTVLGRHSDSHEDFLLPGLRKIKKNTGIIQN